MGVSVANQIVDNVYILDTSSANLPLPWPASGRIQAVLFWSSDTTGSCILTGANTTQVLVRLSNPINAPGTVGAVLGGVIIGSAKLPTLTAGTAWVYFA